MPKGLCLNLFGTLWTREKDWIDSRIINHERIHDAQMRELLYILFYIFYVLEWLFRLVQYRRHKTAYYNISFEREAYANDHNLNYLKSRKPFSWINYLRSE